MRSCVLVTTVSDPTTLSSLLIRAAETQVDAIRDDGSVPPGHNGLYNDGETPVRNTSHWLVTFASLFRKTRDDAFRDAAERLSTYLRSQDARPHEATFHHRDVAGKDRCNGLIGQAWSIEALAVAADELDRPELADPAERVFLLHPQDERTGLWKRVSVNGTVLPYDATFNHQLWFAAAGGLLSNLPETSDRVSRRVRNFLDEVEANVRLYPSGLIFHPLKPTGSMRRLAHLVRTDERGRIGVTFATSSAPIPSYRRDLRWKAIGYHAFNLYAFSLLKKQYPSHSFWETTAWQHALEYINTREYQETVWENEYGPGYNPVGFEVPFTMESFGVGTLEDRQAWVEKQLQRHYDPETHRLDRNTEDGETLTARLYQATRLSDLTLSGRDLQ